MGFKYRLIEQFRNHIFLEKGLSENSISAYIKDIELFLSFNREKDFTAISQADLIDYIELLRKKLKQNSVLRKVSSVKMFYKFVAKELGYTNITDGLDKMKKTSSIPSYLTVEEILKIFDAIGNSNEELRDKLLFRFLFMTGCRISEIVNLKVEDIDFSIGCIRVLGKGDKARVVPIGLELLDSTKDYIDNIRGLFIKEKDTFRLFPSMSRSMFWARVNKYAKKSGIEKRVYPHIFRHSVATLMLEAGANIRVVQELLGHSSIATTEIYTHLSKKRLREVYNNAGIRSDIEK